MARPSSACPRCYPLPRLRRPPEPTPRGGPMPDLATNVLSYGDNLDILRRYLPDAAVDLVDLDPPFNSNRAYNVFFRDDSGIDPASGWTTRPSSRTSLSILAKPLASASKLSPSSEMNGLSAWTEFIATTA